MNQVFCSSKSVGDASVTQGHELSSQVKSFYLSNSSGGVNFCLSKISDRISH